MEQSKIIKGNRLYHALFGWCKVMSPVIRDKVLVDLEAYSVRYYQHGKGCKTITKKQQTKCNSNAYRRFVSRRKHIKRDVQQKD